MSKKFIVETNNDIDKDDVSTCLHNMDHYAFCTFRVTELKPIPEVKRIEAGVLMSPAEICKCDTALRIYFKSKLTGEPFPHNFDCEDIGERLNIEQNCYPREFYRDIETTWDFNSIDPCSLIEVVQDGRILHGLYQRHDDFAIYFSIFRVLKSEIKSIRIVEGAK